MDQSLPYDDRFVLPKVYFVGATEVNYTQVDHYLKDTNQTDFQSDVNDAISQGIPGGLILVSMFAKLCYKSLVVGKNANITSTRSIENNIKNCFDVAHGSVFEHCQLNFLVTNCSRVFTHEQVRHRVGTAYSQTSGRYCRLDKISFVKDPVLSPCDHLISSLLTQIETTVYLMECHLGLRKPPENYKYAKPTDYMTLEQERLKWIPDESKHNFEKRKQITSAIRRIVPNGQSNEIAISCNIRSLRHMIMTRTAREAEWEIRHVYYQIYLLMKDKWPLLFHGAKETYLPGVDIPVISGMKINPWEKEVS